MKKSKTDFQKVKVALRWTMLTAVLCGSIYSYMYLGWQEPVMEAIQSKTQIATDIGPEEGLVILLAKAMKSLLGYI